MSGERVAVTIPVSAVVGPVWLGLFPPKSSEWNGDPDAYDEGLPWAWCAITHVTFHFGRRQTTKKVTARYRYSDSAEDSEDEPPSGEAAETGRLAVLADIRSQLLEHGIDPPEFQIMKADPRPLDLAPADPSIW